MRLFALPKQVLVFGKLYNKLYYRFGFIVVKVFFLVIL